MSRYLLACCALLLVGAGCSSGDTTDMSDLSHSPVLIDSYTDEGVSLEVWSPEYVYEYEDFEFTLKLKNIEDVDHILDSVDIGLGYLSGVQIQGSNPAYYDEWLVGDNTYTHTFQLDIPAGETVEVDFQAMALDAGEYSGALDVCIDTGYECLFRNISIVVK